MPDQRPPRLEAGERATLVALLQYQRDSVVRKVEGVDDEAARRTFVASGTSLLWLARHLTHAEVLWFRIRFAGEDLDVAGDAFGPDDVTVAAAVAAYRATWADVDAIVAAADLDDPCRQVGDASMVNLRWVLAHMLEETARHAGHADILRELLDGATGR